MRVPGRRARAHVVVARRTAAGSSSASPTTCACRPMPSTSSKAISAAKATSSRKGPTASFSATTAASRRNPVFHVTAITHRRDALFQTLSISGRSMSRTDTAQLTTLRTEVLVWRALEVAIREPVRGLRDAGDRRRLQRAHRDASARSGRSAQRDRGRVRLARQREERLRRRPRHRHLLRRADGVGAGDAVPSPIATSSSWPGCARSRSIRRSTGARTGAKAGFDCTVPFGAQRRRDALAGTADVSRQALPVDRRRARGRAEILRGADGRASGRATAARSSSSSTRCARTGRSGATPTAGTICSDRVHRLRRDPGRDAAAGLRRVARRRCARRDDRERVRADCALGRRSVYGVGRVRVGPQRRARARPAHRAIVAHDRFRRRRPRLADRGDVRSRRRRHARHDRSHRDPRRSGALPRRLARILLRADESVFLRGSAAS